MSGCGAYWANIQKGRTVKQRYTPSVGRAGKMLHTLGTPVTAEQPSPPSAEPSSPVA